MTLSKPYKTEDYYPVQSILNKRLNLFYYTNMQIYFVIKRKFLINNL